MQRNRQLRTRGVILKKQPIGESDLFITIHSPDFGKIQAAAKGARRMTSQFSGHLEPLNVCSFQLYRTPQRYTITQCEVEANFKGIRENFERSMLATLLLEIFHKSTYSDEHCRELFNLLEETLHRLHKTARSFITIEMFKLNLLQLIGVLPNLNNCSVCHLRWNEQHQIRLDDEGHLRCQACAPKTGASKIEFPIIKLIHYLTGPDTGKSTNIKLNPQQKKQLRFITNLFLQHYINREIISEKILMQLGQKAA